MSKLGLIGLAWHSGMVLLRAGHEVTRNTLTSDDGRLAECPLVCGAVTLGSGFILARQEHTRRVRSARVAKPLWR